jgi:hypothetical protein
MKFSLLLASLLLSQLSFAQTIKEKKTKQEMLNRTELIITTIEGAREDLKIEDVDSACKKINELFVLYTPHVESIGQHLDFFRHRENKAKDEALSQLIFMHRHVIICAQGKDSEYVDPKKLRKELKEIEKSLKSQRKTIKKSDTSNENSFKYYYEL